MAQRAALARALVNDPRLLILDDEPIVVKRLKPAFQKAGYEVEAFTDSAAALAAFEAAPADIVITDLKMEGLDGIGFLDRIKAEANKRDVPYQSLIKTWLAEKVG